VINTKITANPNDSSNDEEISSADDESEEATDFDLARPL
jgi:hypothetical protein